MGRRNLEEVLDGLGSLKKVHDGTGDPLESPGRVAGPSGWSRTGQGTLGEVRDGSVDHSGGLGRDE